MTERSDESAQPPFPPPELLERLREILPKDRLAAYLDAASVQRTASIRVNPLRTSLDAVITQLQEATIGFEPLDWCEHALQTDATARRLQELPAWDDGGFHIQSLSSIATTLVLDPLPGEHVLDMCAAPGSKTSHIGALMRNSGRLVANDLSRARMHRLRSVLGHLGVEAELRTGPGEKIGHREPGTFDRVLVDAPCSGEGRMRADEPDSHANWTRNRPKKLSSRQKSLLHSAIEAVRPGGIVVYSTCTFAPEENELVLSRALERYGDHVRLETIETELPGAMAPLKEFKGRSIRAMPEAIRLAPPSMDGFFIARLRRGD